MKCFTTFAIGIVAAGIALAVTLATPGGEAKKELGPLQGTWKSVSYEIGGTKIEGDALAAVVAAITIKGNAFEWKAGDSNDKGTIKIDATKDPMHIDFVSEPAAGVKITTWSGIYAVTGDTLKFCLGPGAGQRPKDFSTKGVTYGVFTLRQMK